MDLPGVDAPRLGSALQQVRVLDADQGLTYGVVYGDPAPEILVDGMTVGLIDWGTPSWAPLAHDLACWLRFLNREPADLQGRVFLQSYLTYQRLPDADLSAIGSFLATHDALGLSTEPRT